ncbi:hypothetical protein [Microbulbifer variabilis]|uniref:hypothetical protein n=1 Tax=Microbulbifer variabilis TaxID=266805 RepID=UPI001CFCB564|nr:hypothetical protein [Microbulbifer variabilis]
MADIVVLAAPAMEAAQGDCVKPLFSMLRETLGDDWARLHCDSFPTVEALPGNTQRVFEDMRKCEMDGLRARKFLLNTLAESSALLGDIHSRGGLYDRSQTAIYQTLQKAAAVAGDCAPVLLISHSAGCISLSNYLWDAQRPNVNHGLWRDGGPAEVRKGSARERFLRLKTLSHWYTLGASNPLWCGARARDQIQAVASASRGYQFRWKNFYHPDDLFGWPLKPLSPSYNQAVFRDYETRPLSDPNGAMAGPQLLAPEDYWRNELVWEQLGKDLRALLQNTKPRAEASARRSRRAVAV